MSASSKYTTFHTKTKNREADQSQKEAQKDDDEKEISIDDREHECSSNRTMLTNVSRRTQNMVSKRLSHSSSIKRELKQDILFESLKESGTILKQ